MQNRFFLSEGERCCLAKRTKRNNPGAAIVEQPSRVRGHKLRIHLQMLVEARCHRRHYAIPLHSISFGASTHAGERLSPSSASLSGWPRLET